MTISCNTICLGSANNRGLCQVKNCLRDSFVAVILVWGVPIARATKPDGSIECPLKSGRVQESVEQLLFIVDRVLLRALEVHPHHTSQTTMHDMFVGVVGLLAHAQGGFGDLTGVIMALDCNVC